MIPALDQSSHLGTSWIHNRKSDYQNQTFELKNYKVVLILIGTNNLTPKMVWQWYKEKQRKGESKGEESKYLPLPPHSKPQSLEIQSKYRELIWEIRKQNPDAYLLVSAKLPRIFDCSQNKDYLIDVNLRIEQLCTKFNSCYFLKLYKPLLKHGKPREKYFDTSC